MKKKNRMTKPLEERKFEWEQRLAEREYGLKLKAEERAQRELELKEEELRLKQHTEERTAKDSKSERRQKILALLITVATVELTPPVLDFLRKIFDYVVALFPH